MLLVFVSGLVKDSAYNMVVQVDDFVDNGGFTLNH